MAWSLLNPLLLCLLYGFVFGKILRVQPPSGFPGDYLTFLLSGLLPWFGISESLLRGAAAISENSHFVKKMRFPVETLVISRLGAALALQAAAVGLFSLWLGAVHGSWPNPGLLLAALVFQTAVLAGPVFFLASLTVFFRDLAQLLGPVLMALLYLTPVLYPESQVPQSMAVWLNINPIRDAVGLFRSALTGTPVPPLFRLALESGAALLTIVLGALFFRQTRRSFADLL